MWIRRIVRSKSLSKQLVSARHAAAPKTATDPSAARALERVPNRPTRAHRPCDDAATRPGGETDEDRQGAEGFVNNTIDAIVIFHLEKGAWKLWSEEILGVNLAQ